MAQATDVTLTGTLTDLQGNLLSGTLTFSLEGFGSTVPLIAGTQALPGIVFTATVTNGAFSTNFYSNQIITPGPLVTFYNISFQATGTTNQVYNFSQNYQFSPGTFDLSQLTPLNAVISNTSLPNTVTPHTFTAFDNQFLTGLTAAGNFTSLAAPQIVAKANASGQTANIGQTLLYLVPLSGTYRVSAYVVVTTAATSSTMPALNITFTDNDTGVASNNNPVTATSAGNTVGSTNSVTVSPQAGVITFNAKASTNINYSTAFYASNPASTMQYAVHIKLEYLGS